MAVVSSRKDSQLNSAGKKKSYSEVADTHLACSKLGRFWPKICVPLIISLLTAFCPRYLGYKGVLMLHPQMCSKYHVQFRHSMKKFSTVEDTSFSVVEHSKPYSFGRLNNDIIVLLSSLGITNEKLLAKQNDYFEWIAGASENEVQAIDFLFCMGKYSLAERVLLEGLDDPTISQEIRKSQLSEITSFRNKDDKNRTRMMIHKSRLIFGVCDPFNVLKEGEVQIRITMSRTGPASPIHGDVLVVRNPCLHPGKAANVFLSRYIPI
jgi:regulator of nonsense transcripts 1